MNDDDVRAAFALIQEEIGTLSNEVVYDTMRFAKADDSDEVSRLMRTWNQLEDFQLRLRELEDSWASAFDAATRNRKNSEPAPSEPKIPEAIHLTMEYQSAHARAQLNGRQVTLLPGSKIRKQTFRSMQPDVQQRKNTAIEKGELVDSDQRLFELNVPITFSSPSAAAVFVAGCAVNGLDCWQVEGLGISLNAWQRKATRGG